MYQNEIPKKIGKCIKIQIGTSFKYTYRERSIFFKYCLKLPVDAVKIAYRL